MTGAVVIDANLLVLLVVGTSSRGDIAKHKRLRGYTADDFDVLCTLVAQFSEIVLIPHTLAEASNLARQIADPARARIQGALRRLISTVPELPIPSVYGAHREEFDALGLTDAVLLHLCAMQLHGVSPTLITADRDLADRASSLGYSFIDYKQEFQSREPRLEGA